MLSYLFRLERPLQSELARPDSRTGSAGFEKSTENQEAFLKKRDAIYLHTNNLHFRISYFYFKAMS